MNKRQRLILSFGAVMGGGLLCAFGATAAVNNVVSNTCIVMGLLLAVLGFISFMLIAKKG